MNRLLWTLTILAAASTTMAAEVRTTRDEETGWTIYELAEGDTVARLVPAAGCNVMSIRHHGTEILRVPEKLEDVAGFGYGTPVLYPTPNRVRDSVFTFAGREYRLPRNFGPNFIHGLVHSVRWEVTGQEEQPGRAVVHCRYDFAEGTEAFELFPFPHALELSVEVLPDAVRWTYVVDNSQGSGPVPFGMGLHPYFMYQGSRANSYLTVPATHVMEAVELLPTGKLLPLEGSSFDAREPKALTDFVIDDVYFGMTPQRPASIHFRDAGLRIALAASEDFTHLVVYTPRQPFLCVENQTCSTDAHNLAARGLARESHLMIVEPGGRHSGWVEYRIARDR